jgi:hypothetical protein
MHIRRRSHLIYENGNVYRTFAPFSLLMHSLWFDTFIKLYEECKERAWAREAAGQRREWSKTQTPPPQPNNYDHVPYFKDKFKRPRD